MGGDWIMLIILDKETKNIKENFGTNSLFPDGNLPITEKESEIYVRLHDDSDFSKLIQNAYDYELVLDNNNNVTNVIVNKTLEQYQAEQPSQPSQEELEEAEFELRLILKLTEWGIF